MELTKLFPQRPGEADGAWTDRVLSHATEHGTFRQCSIGWHGECSQRRLGLDGECMCLCHDPAVSMFTVEGHAESGTPEVLRSALGQHRWPPKEGEPATMWACWILARGADDAADRALAWKEAHHS